MRVPVITDSGGGIDAALAKELGIYLLPLQVAIHDKTYFDGENLDINTLYDALEDGEMPITSLPPLGKIEELMADLEREGVKDVILISLSSGLSSTNSAVQASAATHDIKVHTTDICTTLGVERYLALAAADLADQGVAPEEIIARISDSVQNSSGYLIANDLAHLAKGGRLTPAAAKLGGLLKIKPILEVSKNTGGKVDVYDKVRTMSKAVKKAAAKILEELDEQSEYKIIVLDSRNSADADVAADLFKNSGKKVEISREPIYAVIATHTGMNAIGLQYVKKVEGARI
jgi:DegV family protein with EDD domain